MLRSQKNRTLRHMRCEHLHVVSVYHIQIQYTYDENKRFLLSALSATLKLSCESVWDEHILYFKKRCRERMCLSLVMRNESFTVRLLQNGTLKEKWA